MGQTGFRKYLLAASLLLIPSLLIAGTPYRHGYISSTSTANGTFYNCGTMYNYNLKTDSSPNYTLTGGTITLNGTVDGRDVATDGATLDAISAAYLSTGSSPTWTGPHTFNKTVTFSSGVVLPSDTISGAGSGSGLDADKLEGLEGTVYIKTWSGFTGDVSGVSTGTVVANDSHDHTDTTITLTTGAVTSGTWTDDRIADDVTLTNITQITNRSHDNITSTGTNTHATIDSAIYKVKISTSDTTQGYLSYKIQSGVGIKISTENASGNEYLQIATKGAAGQSTYFGRAEIAGDYPEYYLMTTSFTTTSWSTMTVTETTNTDVFVSSFVTLPGYPNVNQLVGAVDCHLYAKKTGVKTVSFYAKFYILSSTGALTQLDTATGVSDPFTTSIKPYDTDIYVNQFVNNTDRIVGVIWLRFSGAASSTQVDLYFEGIYGSHISLPTPQIVEHSDLQGRDLNRAGHPYDSAGGFASYDGLLFSPSSVSTAAYENVRVGTATVALSIAAANIQAGPLGSTVIASSIAVAAVGVPQISATGSPSGTTYLSGDGSWTAPAGAGDAVLASTQTWTGINYGIMPPGTILTYISTNPPAGFLYCNGAAVSTTTYATLYSLIAFKFGNPGSGNMNLPDFRGMFARGQDDGRGFDTDRFDVVGSTQADSMQGHLVNTRAGTTNQLAGTSGAACVSYLGIAAVGNVTATSGSVFGILSDLVSDGANGTPRTAAETRPENIAITYIIKY